MNNLSLFLTCVAIWGTTWLAITYQFGPVAPEVSVSHRFLLAALVIAAWCRLRSLSLKFTRSEHAALALMGTAMYGISYIFVYHAELHVASGLVAIGYSASPLLSTLGMRLFFGQTTPCCSPLPAACSPTATTCASCMAGRRWPGAWATARSRR